MACCDNQYDLGCVYGCDDIVIGTATQTGAHEVIFADGAHDTRFTASFTLGNNIELTGYGQDLDLNRIYDITVFNPDGTTFTRTIDSVEYDCFKVEVIRVKEVTI